jgi:NAD(P)-dependent dehydrogenase (short-subunit alcohol dehydrogenase family)
MRFSGRTVAVTGGTKGIGEGCVEVFAAAGAHVAFCGLEEDLGREVAARVTRDGPGTASFVPCDVTRHDALRAFVASAAAAHDKLDVLINNAGWHPPHRPIDDFTVDELRQLVELNVVSVFAGCQAALPWLRRSRGSIINVASLVGSMGQRHATTYVATKGAVLAFTKALAIDEAEHGVRVNAVSPGNIYTPLWQEGMAQTPDPAACLREGEAVQPLGRLGTPREVGLLCLYLAADATFTTGADHIVSGGAELGYGTKTVPVRTAQP